MAIPSAILGSLISGGLGLLDSFLGRKQDESAMKKNMDLQREFAQFGIRWKVEDAKKAGLHPLAALGANTMSFTPSFVGTGNTYGLGKFGNDISRAISAMQTPEEKELKKVQLAIEKEKLRGMKIQNNQKSIGTKGLPSENIVEPFGIGNFSPDDLLKGNAPVIYKPKEITVSKRKGLEAGIEPFRRHVIDERGRTRTLRSEAISDAMEDDMYNNVMDAGLSVVDRAVDLANYKLYHTAKARAHRDMLREHRPAVENKYQEQRYNPYTGNWHLVDTRKTKDSMFYYIPKFLPKWLVPQKNIPY